MFLGPWLNGSAVVHEERAFVAGEVVEARWNIASIKLHAVTKTGGEVRVVEYLDVRRILHAEESSGSLGAPQ